MNKESKSFLSLLQGRQVNKPPFWYMRQAGRYLPEYLQIRRQCHTFLDLCYNPELAAEVTLQPIHRFGMDAAILFSDILVIPDALGVKVEYLEGQGPKLEPVRNRDHIARLEFSRVIDHLAPVFEILKLIRRELPEEKTLIGFAGSPWTVACYMVEGHTSKEFQETRSWAYKDPEGFQTLIDLLVEATGFYLLEQVKAGAEVVQLFDSWAGVLPEAEFQRWVIEPNRRITAFLKKRFPDLPVIGFPKGAGVKYEAFIRQTGVDAVSLDTSVSLSYARDTLQPLTIVQGNLDPVLLAAEETATLKQAAHILETLDPKRMIFNLGHGIIPQTPVEHVQALSEYLKTWQQKAGGKIAIA